MISAISKQVFRIFDYAEYFLFKTLGMDHYFFIGGLPFLGVADNFFPKSNAFQTIFFHHIL